MRLDLPRLDKVLILPVISGILLSLAFPLGDLYPLAWFGLVPMLLVMKKRPFASGFASGIAFFASTLYWLNIVMTTYGGMALLFSLLAYLFLVVYLAGYFGLATWLACRLQREFSVPSLVSLPVLWVAAEYLRGLLLTGFPWALLGYSQQNFAAAIQSADVTGVYGVSFLLVAVNCALAALLLSRHDKRTWAGVALVVLMTISHIGYGFFRLSEDLDRRSEQLKVSLVQGNIDQKQKWDAGYREANINKYVHLSEYAAQQSPQLIVWPEAATPFYLQENSQFSTLVKQLPEKTGAYFLIGSPAYEGTSAATVRYFNSAFLLGPDGAMIGRSDKIHLVPFGEYVPLASILFFIDKLVVGVGDFSAGSVSPLPVDGQSLGVLVCYEVIFPELARAYVAGGAGLLVNLTNDAWFGRSAAPYQHLAMARFRAIENRVWLARAANTGVSAVISPSGRIIASSPLFEDRVLTNRVGLGADKTFYTRFGDVFAWGCLLVSCLLGCGLLYRRFAS